jgi:hypothetical protein
MVGLEIRMAKLAMDLRRFDEAATWFDRAEQHAPGDASVGWEHAMLDLVREDFAAGWPRYERRLESYGFNGLGIYPYAAPRWTGEPIAGKRLLIHREQGLGDAIMFATAFQGLIDDGAQLHLALAPPLARLMAFNFPKAGYGAASPPPAPRRASRSSAGWPLPGRSISRRPSAAWACSG